MTSPGRFCESCGAALQGSSRFCEACGQPVGAAGGAAAPRAAAVPTADASCPACRQADQVVAAPAYTAASDTDVKSDGDRASPDLVATFLEKPEKPAQTKSVFLWALSALIPTFVFFIYWFAPIHKGFKFFLFGLTIVFFASVFVPTLSQAQIYPFIGLFLLLFYWGSLFIGRDSGKVDYVTKLLPEYNAKLARWEHLRYCKRCQKLWLDNAAGAAPVDLTDIETLLAG